MQFTTSTLALLTGLAAAVPTSTLNPRGISPTFNLLFSAGSTPIPEPVAALKTGIWALGAQNSHAVLFPNRGDGSLFYQYSPSHAIAFASVGMMIFPGGTATVPDGRPIEFEVNNQTSGVEIAPNANGIPILSYDGGRFQACAGEGDEIFLSYIAPGQRQLADCAAVELISACSGTGTGSEMVGQLGKPIEVSCQPH